MQIHTTKKKNLPLRYALLATALVILLVAGYVYYAHHFQKWPFPAAQSTSSSQGSSGANTTNYTAPTPDQVTSGTSTKEQAANAAQNTPSITQPTTTSIPVTITHVEPGSTVQIGTLIGSITSTATCTLQMTGPGGKTYSANSGTQALSTSSTCEGFSVPMTSLSSGSWSVTITVKDGTSSGSASTPAPL